MKRTPKESGRRDRRNPNHHQTTPQRRLKSGAVVVQTRFVVNSTSRGAVNATVLLRTLQGRDHQTR
jgi:hypothetical protein